MHTNCSLADGHCLAETLHPTHPLLRFVQSLDFSMELHASGPHRIAAVAASLESQGLRGIGRSYAVWHNKQLLTRRSRFLFGLVLGG